MNEVLIIALGGYATVGKNTFERILSDLLDNELCYSASFAKKLREDIKDFTVSQFNINPYTQDAEEKRIIRPILIETARIKRKLSKGEYFVRALIDNLVSDGFKVDILNGVIKHDKYKYIIINDLRFAEHYVDKFKSFDEIGFIRNFFGLIVNIKQYIPAEYGDRQNKEPIKIYTKPFSDEEEKNGPLIEKYADFNISWPKCGTSSFEELKTRLINHVRPVYEEIIKLC